MNLHRRDVDELLESVSGDFFQRHVRQPSAGHNKSPPSVSEQSPSKDKEKLTVVRSGVTYSLGTALAAGLESS